MYSLVEEAIYLYKHYALTKIKFKLVFCKQHLKDCFHLPSSIPTSIITPKLSINHQHNFINYTRLQSR